MGQVRYFLGKTDSKKFEEIHQERKQSVIDDNVDIFKRRRSSIKIDFTKPSDDVKKILKNDTSQIRKIRQMVDFDESSIALSHHQKNVHGIIDEE